MFSTQWDKKHNIVVLCDSIEKEELDAGNPRVVFSDELELLGFRKAFSFTKDMGAPICWAVERRYFYCGDLIAKAVGGDLFNEPKMVFYNEKHKKLNQIDIQLLIETNKEKMFIIENEAMDFIKSTYDKYKKSFDAFASAFSGGKDSQVVLDLVSRALSAKDYIVSFTDTGMELPCTIDTVSKTRKTYKKKYKGFKMIVCESEESAISQWQKYGPPSRFSRWCCSVRKSSLFARTMKDFLNVQGQPKIVVFEGVRSDESARREKYNREGKGVKHVSLVNARPIFFWNNTEIYLYIIEQEIDLNPAYKKGLTRVGCNICPFASTWSEYLISKIYPDLVSPYVDVVKDLARGVGLKSEAKILEYISSGNWKKNAGGRGLNTDESRLDIISQRPNLECILRHPKSNWRTWLSVVGQFIESQNPDGTTSGEIRLASGIKKFLITYKDDKIIFKFFNTGDSIYETSLIKKALVKSTYCERCGVCEAECPTGALTVRKSKLHIDTTKCIHCYNCLSVDSCGCIVAARRKVSEGGIMANGTNSKTSGVDKYSTFGLRDPWVDSFFDEFYDFFIDYGGLGTKQITAVLNWLREAELVDQKTKQVTPFAEMMKSIFEWKKYVAMQIIWINLCFNSAMIRNYVLNLSSSVSYSKKDIVTMVQEQYPDMTENTLKNPVGALFNMFAAQDENKRTVLKSNSSFGCTDEEQEFIRNNLKMGVVTKLDGEVYVTKVGTDKLSTGSILYLLYKIAENENRYEYTASEFYKKAILGPKTVFNMSFDAFCASLRALDNEGYLRAELVAGLDNIHLFDKYSSSSLLKQWWENHK